MDFRIGNGYDVHQLAEGLSLVLCGVKIPHTKGCVAHSDGDAAIHAICDAMLGALALGDIGHHFPDTDPAYSGIDSRILLRRVHELVAEMGWQPVNVDCTIMLQKPKVAPYIEQMRACLAEDLSIGVDRVSVKATTTERLGFVGREEGVAAQATVLLQRI
jgi:2-C-methyl-D-erythritol 2,4-cyclodiphosphate synthase